MACRISADPAYNALDGGQAGRGGLRCRAEWTLGITDKPPIFRVKRFFSRTELPPRRDALPISHYRYQVLVVNHPQAENFASPVGPPAMPQAPGNGVSPGGSSPPKIAPAKSEESSKSQSRFSTWFVGWLLDSESCSWLASGVMHLTIMIILSLIVITQRGLGPEWTFESTPERELPTDLDIDIEQFDSLGEQSTEPNYAPQAVGPTQPQLGSTDIEVPTPEIAPQAVSQADMPTSLLPSIGQPLASLGGGLEGRNPENRLGLALAGGGSEASEAAVEAGLEWLAAHQRSDGSWTFYLDAEHCPPCSGRCRNPGVLSTTTAPTGMALLCFLGAGYTHQQGPYRDAVNSALYYLVNRMLITEKGGDLRDATAQRNPFGLTLPAELNGDMYSHAIASLALCEAYAMTKDPSLSGPAQKAIDFIVNAQNELGGWRYNPLQPGDLSVTGWQLMALKSGVLGRLDIPRPVWYRASDFLDSVQNDHGATYAYQDPALTTPTMTAVGLYSRMMIGWRRDNPALLKGCALLAKEKPTGNTMYFNYYNSQVLHHVGGNGWVRWNKRMRDFLVTSQADSGHEDGSWYIDEKWSDRGGRLYTTTLAILTLEVYYRYMPMYQDQFIDTAP